jgi:hypothetical protein
MNLSILKDKATRQWAYLICLWVGWITFVLATPSHLKYPWYFIILLFAILSPYVWHRAVMISISSESLIKDKPGAVSRAEGRRALEYWIYIICGTLTWVIFVSNIASNRSHFWKELYIVIGAVAPFLWINSIKLYHRFKYRYEDQSKNLLGDPSIRTRTIVGFWLYSITGSITWIIFVGETSNFLLIPWDVVYGVGFLLPSLWAVFYSNFHAQKSKPRECKSESYTVRG